MQHSFNNLILYFAIYSFIGWLAEVVYCSIPARKLIKRGLLAGPYCPIYGFGAIFLLLLIYPLAAKPDGILLVFLASVVITSALEYFTSWLLEVLFHMKLWDYSTKKFNLHGRVCLLNSSLFGLMGILLLYVIQPMAGDLIAHLSTGTKAAFSSLFLAALLLDFVTTLNGLYKLNTKARTLFEHLQELHNLGKDLNWQNRNNIHANLDTLQERATATSNQAALVLIQQIRDLLDSDNSGRRILTSFKTIRHTKLPEQFKILQRSFEERKGILREEWEKHTGISANTQKQTEVSFAEGIHYHKLVWVFFIASFAGFVVESLYCIVRQGYLESRQGMIYGPFNQIYGFGAVILVLLLNHLSKKGDRWLFFGSMLIGGAFEYLCSLIQELLFGSVSWDYTGQTYSFGGRTSLTYMFFWGILGTVLMKEIYPRISRFVERIPNRQGITLTTIIAVFLALNMAVSGIAVYRWRQRDRGLPAVNAVERYMDYRYPDSFLKEIYPNLNFVKKTG